MVVWLNEEQMKIYRQLRLGEAVPVGEILERTGLLEPPVMGFCVYAQRQGWVEIAQEEKDEFILRHRDFEELPERRFLREFSRVVELETREVASKCRELGLNMGDILKWGALRGWFRKEGKRFEILPEALRYLDRLDEDERALEYLRSRGRALVDELVGEGIDRDRLYRLLARRSSLVKVKRRTFRTVKLLRDLRPKLKQERVYFTPEELESGAWRELLPHLKPYDVRLPAKEVYPAKAHPLQRILHQTRQAFLELGFLEIVSPCVESAFWDFDALFQPQDHPAREMQDTFYLEHPREGKLPASSLVRKVSRTHEDGGDTGSKGWGYRWSGKLARQLVLRTHTTASTVRALASHPRPPLKVFCVGRVFRNETISFKHLPEFHQVDGIIVDERGSFATLLGTLRAFYRKMGFDSVKFKPAFFPYTEPSAEVFVWMESKGEWIEMGGAGLFRPEVTEPLGCKVPVLAWGLGLERLAMLRYGVDDIRSLYWSDMKWLKEVKLCQ
ncbi:MAG: phenylalanine--tRNA ligase subunit alpha [Planctomycetota bacterium]|nr:MAG: phenylalanine--tRNA ligase subunit alpha [Planctomycetota bacterium]